MPIPFPPQSSPQKSTQMAPVPAQLPTLSTAPPTSAGRSSSTHETKLIIPPLVSGRTGGNALIQPVPV